MRSVQSTTGSRGVRISGHRLCFFSKYVDHSLRSGEVESEVSYPNALLIFRSGSNSGDYHDYMNHANYKKWLQEKLGSLYVFIVVGNAG